VTPHFLDVDLYLVRQLPTQEGSTPDNQDTQIAKSDSREGEEVVVQVLAAGNYSLLITFMPGPTGIWVDTTEYIPFNFDVSIAPVSFVHQMIKVRVEFANIFKIWAFFVISISLAIELMHRLMELGRCSTTHHNVTAPNSQRLF
jgi:hypothetical protein